MGCTYADTSCATMDQFRHFWAVMRWITHRHAPVKIISVGVVTDGSDKLPERFEYCSRLTVIRDGLLVHTMANQNNVKNLQDSDKNV